MDEIRIHKYLADCGVSSRRGAEKLIAEGRVTVNGKIAAIGQKIVPSSDRIEIDGNEVTLRNEEFAYILLNKPAGYVTTVKDDRGRPTVCDLVSIPGKRLFPVGRLDMYTEGLIILTDDGDSANRLIHPTGEVTKTYVAYISSVIGQKEADELSLPIVIDGKATRPAKVAVLSSSPDGSTVEFTIGEGRNRQIRRLCERSGLRIKKLKRTRIGEIYDESLKPGMWRSLNKEETEYLKGL